jgi:hypothetical protein
MLLEKVRELISTDPETDFVVLTPRRAITITMVVGGEHRTATEIALERATRTVHRLKSVGAKVVANRLGGFDPLPAIAEELKADEFRGVIVSTLQPGLSAWLRQDLPSKLRSQFPDVEVIHLVAPSAFYLEAEPANDRATQRRK